MNATATHLVNRSVLTETNSNFEGALLLGEIEYDGDCDMEFEMNDFLNDGQRKVTPLERALSLSSNIDPHSAVSSALS